MTNQINEVIRKHITASISVKEAVLNNEQIALQIESLVQICIESLKTGGKVIFAGNGGSFADAQHLSAELTSRLMFDRAPLASLALGTNNSSFSAIGNDYGFVQVFSRELEAIGRTNDVFIPITTSGNSNNIIQAVTVANRMGIRTIGLTGDTGGVLKTLCDCILIPSKETALIQECHIMLGHILCKIIESKYFTKN